MAKRDPLESDLDANGHRFRNLQHAVNDDEPMRKDDVASAIATGVAGAVVLTTTPPVAVDADAADLGIDPKAAAGDHKHHVAVASPVAVGTTAEDGTSKSLARADHVHPVPFGPVAAALAGATSDVSFNDHLLTDVASGGATPTNAANIADVGAGVAAAAFAVANNAALTALDASKLGDGASRRVATYRDWFDLDKITVRMAVPDVIVAASGGSGWWWVRRMEADPSWLAVTSWTISPSGGSDEGTTTIKTRTELARRLGSGKLPAPITVTITGNLASDDTTMPRCQSDFTNFISWVGVPTVLFTGLITGYVARSGAGSQPTTMTCSGLTGTSWSDSGPGSTSLVGKVIEWTDGAGAFICARVVEDLGLKVATLSPPIRRPTNLEDVFVNGTTRTLGATTINVYDLPALPSPLINRETNTQYSYLSATQWLNFRGGLTMTNCTGECAVNGGVVVQTNGRGIAAGFVVSQGSLSSVVGGHQRLICGNGAIRFNGPCTVTSLQVETNGVISALSGGGAGTIDIEVNNSSTSLPVIVFNGIDGGRLHCQGFVYGKSAISSGHLAEFQGRSGLVSFSQTPNVTGAALIAYTLASTTDNVSVLATRESNDVNGNRFIGPAGPTVNDNRSAPIAHLGSGGTTGTNGANIADAQGFASAAQAASVPLGGHAAESIVGNPIGSTGNAVDIAISPDSVAGRSGTGAVGSISMTAAGRAMAGAANATAQTALLDAVTSANKGLAPASGGGASNFLRADGTWVAPPGVTALFTPTSPGLAPAGTGGPGTFLAPDGSWSVPSGTGPALSSSAPSDVTKASAAVGTASTSARADHKHDVSTAAAGTAAVGASAAEGTANSLARSDHAHAVPRGTPVDVGTTNAAGTSTSFAGADHVHALTFPPVRAALAAASSSIDVGGQQVINGADPTTPSALATKNYVDTLAAGLKWKKSVRVAITAPVVLATDVQNGSVQDGVTLQTGDLVSLHAQTAGAENGRYLVNPTGAPTRATDADTGSELVAATWVSEAGTVNHDKAWVVTNDSITIGTTAITIVNFQVIVGALLAINNLSDLTNVPQARTNLGLFPIASSGSAGDLSSGTVPAARLPQFTGGSVTSPTAGSVHLDLVTIPDATPVPGRLRGHTSAQPGSNPPAGTGDFWFDNADSIWKNIDESGNVTHMTRAQAAVAHKFITGINADGSVSNGQPDYDDLTGVPRPWALYQFVWSEQTNTFPGSNDRWLSSYIPVDGSLTDRRFPFAGAGRSSTAQSLQVSLNYSDTVGSTGLVTFTLQVNGVDTALSQTVPLTPAPGSSVPLLFGQSAALTIADGSMIGVRMSESVAGGPVSSANWNAHVTLILR